MKESVIETVRVLGAPKENTILKLHKLKRCAMCGKIKKFSDFHTHKEKPLSYCIECERIKGAIYREKMRKKKLQKGA